jgi:hypothetical protein
MALEDPFIGRFEMEADVREFRRWALADPAMSGLHALQAKMDEAPAWLGMRSCPVEALRRLVRLHCATSKTQQNRCWRKMQKTFVPVG